MTRAELGDWINRRLQHGTVDELNRARDGAWSLAQTLGVSPKAMTGLDNLIGAALGTRDAPDLPHSIRQRKLGVPFDSDAVQRFDILVHALRTAAPQNNPARTLAGSRLPFFEAYFSNYIVGTEFTVSEAADIVFQGIEPAGRPEDSRDLADTYRVVSDLDEMEKVAASPAEFIELLKARHVAGLGGRTDKRPGLFKERANQAGNTLFVAPDLVTGTLIEGFRRLDRLDSAWERSVYAMFLVSEVHPFDDGNGRLARVMMNSELDAGGQSRTVIPTVFRDDYLGALRRLSRADDPTVLIKALRYANDWTFRVDFSDFDTALAQMEAAHAFADPGGDDRLLMPNLRDG